MAHRAVAGVAASGQPHPRHTLLGRLDEVEPLPADGGAEAADLTHGFGAPLEELRTVPADLLGTLVPASLLVGGEAQHHRSGRLGTGPCAGPDDREQHRVEVL